MPQNAAQTRVAVGGKIHSAPVGTAAPADVQVAWPAGWIDLGYANEDGIRFREARTKEEIRGWPGLYVLRRVLTEKDVQLVIVLRQWNKDTILDAMGGGTITSFGSPTNYKFAPAAAGAVRERAVGIEWVDGTLIYRLIALKADPVNDDLEIPLSSSEAADLPVTWGVNATEGVDPWYFITNDPAFA
jgi:hypothetical protein